MSKPTRFYIENGRLVQAKETRAYFSESPAALELPYSAVFTAKLKIIGSDTNYNGATYFEWLTGANVTMYSGVRDFTEIVTTLKPDVLGYYDGMFTFVTRGGTYRSLQLVRNTLTPEPNIANTKQGQYIKLAPERINLSDSVYPWLKK